MEPRVVQADNAGLFTLSGTRTHLVGRERVVVLDPGPADPPHLDRLCQELDGASHVTILVTHGHADHSAGALPLARALEGGVVPGVARVRVMGAGAGIPETLTDQQRIPTDQGTLRALWTPGHARPHFAFLWEEPNLLFPGDLLLGEGNTAWVGSYPGCVADYLASLDRLESLSPARLLPAHGPPLEDPAKAIERFRGHRLHRLEQVAAAVHQDPAMEADRIVDRIYGPALPSSLRGAARWSVLALLDHLGARPFPPGAPLEEG
jgi:glyoxylase-like metal-dependent hydrolase (beta-lactamase superfamily II)